MTKKTEGGGMQQPCLSLITASKAPVPCASHDLPIFPCPHLSVAFPLADVACVYE